MAQLRIVLVDDHAVVRDGLQALINAEADMCVVGVAAEGHTAIAQVGRHSPDVVVLDVTMPGLSGVETTRRLLEIDPATRVLALSVHESTSYVRELVGAGAVGYIFKRSAGSTLIMAIRMAAAGQFYIDPAIAGRVVSEVLRPLPAADPGGQQMLSPRELAVLPLVAQGYSNREVAALLSLSPKTVETYKARALEKLGLSSRAALVRYALEAGWLRHE
jgi:DNA-binding NarL/FixJ family response regulator